ncbi:hypothetical protein IAT38_008208 [Cryptococcus sp. DSM 104549]
MDSLARATRPTTSKRPLDSRPSPSRPSKRIREATPIADSIAGTNPTDGDYSTPPPQLAAAPPPVVVDGGAGAGEGAVDVDADADADDGSQWLVPPEDSEGGEGEGSVLFSEKTVVLAQAELAGEASQGAETHTLGDDELPDAPLPLDLLADPKIPRLKTLYVEEFAEDTSSRPSASELFVPEETSAPPTTAAPAPAADRRRAMPPPTDTRSRQSQRSTSAYDPFSAPPEIGKPDRMTQVIEERQAATAGSTSTSSSTAIAVTRSVTAARRSRSFVELNDETRSDDVDEDDEEEREEEEVVLEESYHSGDSDDFEMDHRRVLERTAVKKDIKEFTAGLNALNGKDRDAEYKVVDRLGEGTFSSVYLAIDSLHHTHANEYWRGVPDEDPRLSEDGERPKVRVALKKILVTSSAMRIENELAILESLRGCRNVSQLITAFREEDQVIIVLPYHQSDDFRYFYKHMDPPHIRSYIRNLMRGLKDMHKRGIVHRDVKPANFLYDYESQKGILVDFGLAERYVPPREPTCQHAPGTLTSLHGSKVKTSETATVEQALYDARKKSKLGEGRVGFLQDDKRPAIRTNRAGTRGFRAPEVLLKCPDQTVSIDVWSVGVVLLSILGQKFPAFNSSDDIEALMEIAAIFGRTPMERCALLHNRTIISNVPTFDTAPSSLSDVILKLNPHLYTPHTPNPSPEEALAHIEQIDQVLDLCTKMLRLDATKRLTAAGALRHPFLKVRKGKGEEEGVVQEDLEEEEVLEPTEGKCGDLHAVLEGGRHRAYLYPLVYDLQFGQGVPPSRDALCPEHEHYQQRYQYNPLVTRQRMTSLEDEDVDEEEDEDEEDEDKFVIERAEAPSVSRGVPAVAQAQGGRKAALKERDVNSTAPTSRAGSAGVGVGAGGQAGGAVTRGQVVKNGKGRAVTGDEPDVWLD